ncbi:MAG: hypothetical protein NC413_09985 [Muribaculum sp.]|nr:hypothetical protein [Muribaculum sp.]
MQKGLPSLDIKQVESEENIAKYTIKDSVFSDLFKSKKYLIQLYKALHPEDVTATEDELTDITIRNVLTDNLYNDLGFSLGEKIFILVEAQSVWTLNIIIRALLYLAQTYHDYFERTNQNLYKSKKVKMPKPELYVVYVGNHKNIPDEISLSKEFFGGADIAIDVKVKVICENDTDSIINQYIIFSKVYDEQRTKYGRTKKAITETIRICKDRNVLREYLEDREKEVVSIMMSLYDEEEVMRSYIKSERYEAEQIKVKEKASLMLKNGKITVEEMPVFFPELSSEEIREIEADVMQPM